MEPTRGALEPPEKAPAEGERNLPQLRSGGVQIEQILSGRLRSPQRYLAPHDEWAVVLAGRGRLLVAGAPVTLLPGEWIFLPAGCDHTLLETDPGTSWLVVHLPSVEAP